MTVALKKEEEWVEGIAGNFRVPSVVLALLPDGSSLLSAYTHGHSSWAETAKLTVALESGARKSYFIKCSRGKTAEALTAGEYHSAKAMNEAVEDICPEPTGWGIFVEGVYINPGDESYFYLGDFHDMDLSIAPDAAELGERLAALHTYGVSSRGMFGFDRPTVIGKMQRTVTWEKSWAVAFTNQLKDVQKYDNEANRRWPELDDALQQLYDVVIPRLLGILQSGGREITPVLIHGDLWERNVGIDKNTGKMVIFDPGCTYAHNEFEFGTWRCSWTTHFKRPEYLEQYWRFIKPSEPAVEWNDRNRLYSIHPLLTDSAGHPYPTDSEGVLDKTDKVASASERSRMQAYNETLYLCNKYGPHETMEQYDRRQALP